MWHLGTCLPSPIRPRGRPPLAEWTPAPPLHRSPSRGACARPSCPAWGGPWSTRSPSWPPTGTGPTATPCPSTTAPEVTPQLQGAAPPRAPDRLSPTLPGAPIGSSPRPWPSRQVSQGGRGSESPGGHSAQGGLRADLGPCLPEVVGLQVWYRCGGCGGVGGREGHGVLGR